VFFNNFTDEYFIDNIFTRIIMTLKRQFIRYLVVRRKENLVVLLLFTVLITYCIYHPFDISTFLNKNQLHEQPGDELVLINTNAPFHTPPDYSKPRQGPGENGEAVRMVGVEQKKLANESMTKWFMNLVASDQLDMDRSVPDTRPAACKSIEYDHNSLPNASVVIIFTNEAWTPLLRTVHSVFNRSPPKLLHEIILLDDASDRGEVFVLITKFLYRFYKYINNDVYSVYLVIHYMDF